MGYILRHYPIEEMWELIGDLREGICVLPTNDIQLDITLKHSPVKDYEDLLQYQCALEGKCDVIVTNNKRDYMEFSNLPVYTSKEFLIYYFRQKG